jgi:hypothetical protein
VSGEQDTEPAPPAWHVIRGDALLGVLRRCHDGEDPELVYAEIYVNGEMPDA